MKDAIEVMIKNGSLRKHIKDDKRGREDLRKRNQSLKKFVEVVVGEKEMM